MVGKFHGVFSLLLILAAVVMALFYLLSRSIGWGLVYLCIIIIANPVILYSYCAKCLCRQDACSHIFPGKLTRLLPARKQAPYSFLDYFTTAISFTVLFGFPQVWLRQRPAIFILFWILLIVGLVEILIFVCRACSNTNCPNCRLRAEI
jgi:hypothetical protein